MREKTVNPKSKAREIFWMCECECGNSLIVSTTDLTSGKTSQCWDCCSTSSGKTRRKSIVGNKFGRLTVIEMIYGVTTNSGKKISHCKCLCDCGNVVVRARDTLFSSKTPSCGCARKEIFRNACGTDVDGMKFGKLKVIETLWEETPVKLKCMCDCGNEYIGVKTQITYGRTQSCGCLQREMASLSNEKDWTSHVSPYGIKFISQNTMNSKGQWLWNCECGLCGNHFVCLPARVNNGHITSCGCNVHRLSKVSS